MKVLGQMLIGCLLLKPGPDFDEILEDPPFGFATAPRLTSSNCSVPPKNKKIKSKK